MRQFFLGFLVVVLAIGTSPESILRLSPSIEPAFARGGGRGGGFSRGSHSRPSGARTRPSASRPAQARPRPSGPSSGQRPAAAQRPTKPAEAAAKPATRPSQPSVGSGQGPKRPDTGLPGANRPAGARPSTRPVGDRQPGARPPGNRPPGAGNRPPNWRPPNSRPPNYRPPYHSPPYYRPPHYRWGSYYWGPRWGWFFTAAIVGSTLVYVTTLPEDTDCQKVVDEGETLYLCDGVLYRATYYKDEKVYEIVSDSPEQAAQEPTSVVGLAVTTPLTSGAIVRDLQNRLVGAGYDVGGVHGVYGEGTQTAVEWYQYDNELGSTGVIDAETAAALGF